MSSRGWRAILRGVAAALAAGWLAACGDAAPTRSEIEAFLGTSLPAGATDVRVAEERGIDRLIRLRLDAPEAQAEAFTAQLVPGGLSAGHDPGLASYGGGIDWWVDAASAEAEGGQTSATGVNRVVKVLSVPLGPDRRRVWIAAFTL